ncbi:patatin-like phospholipase family protein [Iamia sp. SCSIO 61187]|uniref:patatin-like phospholipase family protein n=1 Tax=Iamia sp. SCSIO 61187 TaxID=2722752 RepID=UPI001C62F329|nr:patatin-like phospholipase family protein [Iamia sp. SCSIO 61187]QYG95152.1 patatin-like phospholipase family protein [Iamia sp. SCSIO 61187]
MSAPRVGLVLGAGGTVGGAFHSGVLAALAEATGWDPRTAQVIVGTSAGSITGTGLRAGLSAADGYARNTGGRVSPEGARLLAAVSGGGRRGGFDRTGSRRLRPARAMAATLAGAAVRPLAARPAAVLAGLAPDGVVGTDMISGGVDALTQGRWPADPLWICAVRQRDGRRVVFGRDARPPLPAAVAASCAIPSFFAPVDVDGEAYIDGGAHSPTNADVLRHEELDLVVVVSPMSIAGRGLRLAPDQLPRRWARARLDGEARRLRRRGVPLLAFQPTAEDAAVMAGNALDPAKAGPVARAARASTLRRLERPDVLDRVDRLVS